MYRKIKKGVQRKIDVALGLLRTQWRENTRNKRLAKTIEKRALILEIKDICGIPYEEKGFRNSKTRRILNEREIQRNVLPI